MARPTLVRLLSLLLFLTPLAIAATAGCGKNPSSTSTGSRSMTINGKNRRYIVRLPNNYDNNRPYRLIFGPHWLNADYTAVDGGSAPYYGLRALSNNSAIFVAPDGLNRGWGNAGGEDVAFFDSLVKTLSDDLCINEKLIFSLGFSYGGAMSYSLACSRPEVFRAVAVLSGAQLSGCSGGTAPVPFYSQHGVRDSVLNLSMGKQLRDNMLRRNGCQSKNAPEPGRNSRQAPIKTEYSCREGYPVTFVAFDGDHVALPDQQGNDAGPRSWTPAEVWKFFEQFQ
ncbi:alpha/beta-hydrolase [Naviculisporaceae sp. PSN 640]